MDLAGLADARDIMKALSDMRGARGGGSSSSSDNDMICDANGIGDERVVAPSTPDAGDKKDISWDHSPIPVAKGPSSESNRQDNDHGAGGRGIQKRSTSSTGDRKDVTGKKYVARVLEEAGKAAGMARKDCDDDSSSSSVSSPEEGRRERGSKRGDGGKATKFYNMTLNDLLGSESGAGGGAVHEVGVSSLADNDFGRKNRVGSAKGKNSSKQGVVAKVLVEASARAGMAKKRLGNDDDRQASQPSAPKDKFSPSAGASTAGCGAGSQSDDSDDELRVILRFDPSLLDTSASRPPHSHALAPAPTSPRARPPYAMQSALTTAAASPPPPLPPVPSPGPSVDASVGLPVYRTNGVYNLPKSKRPAVPPVDASDCFDDYSFWKEKAKVTGAAAPRAPPAEDPYCLRTPKLLEPYPVKVTGQYPITPSSQTITIGGLMAGNVSVSGTRAGGVGYSTAVNESAFVRSKYKFKAATLGRDDGNFDEYSPHRLAVDGRAARAGGAARKPKDERVLKWDRPGVGIRRGIDPAISQEKVGEGWGSVAHFFYSVGSEGQGRGRGGR